MLVEVVAINSFATYLSIIYTSVFAPINTLHIHKCMFAIGNDLVCNIHVYMYSFKIEKVVNHYTARN